MKFHDPMVDPMPDAPSLKMFNVYGVGKPTERYIAWPALAQPDHLGTPLHRFLLARFPCPACLQVTYLTHMQRVSCQVECAAT